MHLICAETITHISVRRYCGIKSHIFINQQSFGDVIDALLVNDSFSISNNWQLLSNEV